MKILPSDVLGLVLSYLQESGYTKAVEYIKKKAKYEDEENVYFQVKK